MFVMKMKSEIRSKSKNLFYSSILSLLTVLVMINTASAQEVTQLQDINFTSLPGDRMQINLSFSGPIEQPSSFNVDDPPRIALDFANTKSALPWRSRRIGNGLIKSVSAIEAGARTRIVINLVKQSPYVVKQQGDQIVVTLGSGSETSFVNSPAPMAATGNAAPSTPDVKNEPVSQLVTTPATLAASTEPSIQQVDFRRGDAGEGRIFVTFNNPNVVIDVRQESGKIVVDFMNTNLPGPLHQRLDVVDFATPVSTVDTFSEANNVRMVITPSGEYEHLAYQSDNTLTIDVKPVMVSPDIERRKAEYKGEKLSLNFQDIEVRAVLQLLADFSGLNVVVSDSVQGNITLRLKNTPWDQALDIILKTKGLAMRQNGNVILVAPGEEIAQRERLELEAKKQITELTPLRSELVQINYAKATELADIIKSDKNTLLSTRGNITVDQRTNTLLVRDTLEHIDEIRKLITSLDIPIRQVLIESRIVIAEESFTRELGASMSGASNSTGIGQSLVAADTSLAPGATLTRSLPNNSASFFSNGGGFFQGVLGMSSRLLEFELKAKQTEGIVEVVSSPRVITSNQRKARIEDGQEIPFLSGQTSTTGTTTTFKKAVMSLEVTPQITPDDRVILDIKVTKDTPSLVDSGNNSTSIAINTKEVETQVLVNNGETVVLGGIYIEEHNTSESKIPLLGDIPLLGWLFRTKTTTDDKRELLIFVTPKILKEQLKLQ